MMRWLAPLAGAGVLLATPAFAADPCLTAPVDGQKLRRAGKLLDARKSFTFCARESCPREVAQACTRWEHDVEASVPSAVLTARDDVGRDVTARVAIDGGEPTSLGLRAIELDPGEHRFVFTREGSAPVEQSVVLREGEKNRIVTALFPSPRAAPPAPAPEASWWTPLRTTGAVTGGVGGVALVTGFVVAGLAKSSYDSARDECKSTIDCPRDAVTRSDEARTMGDIATVIVVAGAGVSLVGTALLLLAPSSRAGAPKAAHLDVMAGPLSLRLIQRW